MDKIKTISKYAVNILCIIDALILVLDPIWGIPFATQISQTITGVVGVMGTYLIGTKTVNTIKKGKE